MNVVLDSPAPARSTVRTPLRWAWTAPVAGVALGVLDLTGQTQLPYPWADLANSPAVWALATFAFTLLTCPGRALRGALCGVVVLVVGVEAYEVSAVVALGDATSNTVSPATVLWLLAGVVAGALFGAGGAAARHVRTGRRVVCRAMPSGLVFGEAFAMLRLGDPGTSQTQAAAILVAIGVLVLGASMAVSRRRVAEWGLTALACVPMTMLAFGAYVVAVHP